MLTKSEDTTNSQAGQITVKQTKRGTEFWGPNFQRGKEVYFGTIKGQVYEVVKAEFRQRHAFCLNQSEFAAVLQHGATYINVIPVDRSRTYSIDVERFARYAQPYEHPDYGRQLACKIDYFRPSNEVEPRNARRDNPPIPVARDIIEEKLHQMDLFK